MFWVFLKNDRDYVRKWNYLHLLKNHKFKRNKIDFTTQLACLIHFLSTFLPIPTGLMRTTLDFYFCLSPFTNDIFLLVNNEILLLMVSYRISEETASLCHPLSLYNMMLLVVLPLVFSIS